MTIPGHVQRHRLIQCRTCPAPCAAFQDHSIRLDAPLSMCPLDRHLDWAGVVFEDGEIVPTRPPLSPGAQLWAEIHRKGWHRQIDDAFLKVVPLKLAALGQGCSCQRHYEEMLQRIPFRADDQFACTVEWHNDVNARLGKSSQWTLEQARQRWTEPPG